jgi:toxin CptA
MMVMTIEGAAFAVALLCAALMGVAIQRGGTCAVAAVDEVLSTRRPTRLLAMMEASLWVAGGLLVAREVGRLVELPSGYVLTRWTLVGAAMLGLGAVVNRACAVGTIARLGSGQWAFAATPVGFFLGCASADHLFPALMPQPLTVGSPLQAAPGWVAWVVLFAFLARVLHSAVQRRSPIVSPWSPHAATVGIGISFVVMMVVAGAWAYTDTLADLAHGMTQGAIVRMMLVIALLAGAIAGGFLTGQIGRTRLKASDLLRCAGGGVLMGWGSVMIPGSNDGLILLGLPLFWPYAWAAMVLMCAAIALALVTSRWLLR